MVQSRVRVLGGVDFRPCSLFRRARPDSEEVIKQAHPTPLGVLATLNKPGRTVYNRLWNASNASFECSLYSTTLPMEIRYTQIKKALRPPKKNNYRWSETPKRFLIRYFVLLQTSAVYDENSKTWNKIRYSDIKSCTLWQVYKVVMQISIVGHS